MASSVVGAGIYHAGADMQLKQLDLSGNTAAEARLWAETCPRLATAAAAYGLPGRRGRLSFRPARVCGFRRPSPPLSRPALPSFQEGGGLYNHKSNLTIIRSTFGANTAPTGRALANHGDTWQDLKTAGDGAANSSGRPQRLKQSGHPRARCRRSTGLAGA